jgi:hypothetical protein
VPSVVIGPSIVSFFLMLAEKALGLRKNVRIPIVDTKMPSIPEMRQKVEDLG